LVQPFEQLPAPACDDGVLRQVRVDVYEAGKNDRAVGLLPVDGLRAVLPPEELKAADLDDAPIADDHGPVAPSAQLAVFGGVNDAAAEAEQWCGGFHEGAGTLPAVSCAVNACGDSAAGCLELWR